MKSIKSNSVVILSIIFFFFCVSFTSTSESLIKNTNHAEKKSKKLPNLMNKFLGLYGNKKKTNKFFTTNFLFKKEKIHRKNKKKEKFSVKKNKKIKYKTKLVKNSLLINVKIKERFKKCSIRSGVLYLLIKRPLKPNYEIEVTPSYIMLTSDRLIITKDMNIINLIQSVALKEIQRIDQHYENTFCFDVIVNQVVKTKLKNGLLTLCAKNEKEMNSWINSVLEFKKCTLKEVQKADHNKTIFVDFNKINKIAKNEKNKLDKLFYDSTDKTFKHKGHSRITKSLERLITTAKMADIASNQLRRQYKGRLRKADMFSQKIIEENFRLHNRILNKNLKEKELESRLIHKSNKRREIDVINEAETQIQENKFEELKEYKKIYEDQINMEKKHAKSESVRMMHMINSQNKLTDYRVCYDMKLLRFENKNLVSSMCSQYYGRFAEDTCKEQKNFCTMCCDFHIGVNFAEKRLICKKKCTEVIFAKKKINLKKLKKKLKNKLFK